MMRSSAAIIVSAAFILGTAFLFRACAQETPQPSAIDMLATEVAGLVKQNALLTEQLGKANAEIVALKKKLEQKPNAPAQ